VTTTTALLLTLLFTLSLVTTLALKGLFHATDGGVGLECCAVDMGVEGDMAVGVVVSRAEAGRAVSTETHGRTGEHN